MSAPFTVDFLGCKVSQTDAEAIRDALVAAGHVEHAPGSVVADPTTTAGRSPQVHVVNTCCITAHAEASSRKRVRRALRAGGVVVGDAGNDPAAPADGPHVFVTGCGASLAPGRFDDFGPRVTVLPGTAAGAAATIARTLDQLPGLGCKGVDDGLFLRGAARAPATRRTRAFVPVQDGCSFRCSYCIVPTVRGAVSRSRSTAAVLADVARRVERGQREIVLTGINIGLFRDPGTRAGLPRLLLAVAEVEGVERVRISSIESNHVDRRLVEAMAAHPKVCPHLHVPLQSGDDAVLATMRRNYDARGWLRSVERARAALPGLNLTTDVIVGFPGEHDAAFARTLAACDAAGVTKVHAFPFSPRPGTDAASGDGQGTVGTTPVAVPPDVVQARSRVLRAAADERARAHWNGRVGSRDVVLVERPGAPAPQLTAGHVATDGAAAAPDATLAAPRARTTGYARDYSPVRIDWGSAEPATPGTAVAVELVGVEEGGLIARLPG